MNKKIMNLTPHTLNIISEAEFDPAIRKYRGGETVLTILSSGMVSAKYAAQTELDPILVEGVEVQTMSAPKWVSVDPLPEAEEGTLLVVSALDVAACKELGIPTNNLLTIGNAVVAEDNRTVLGCTCLVRN